MKILTRFGRPFTAKKEIRRAKRIQNITIFGYADCGENDGLYKNVIVVCKRLAQMGYTVIDGGGPGVMRAATVGAKMGGGRVIGVTFEPAGMTNFEGRDLQNPFDEEIRTRNYVERTLMMMKEGQVYIVFKGGTGTISEFGMAWGLARLYFGHHKPLILYGKFWHNIIKAFKNNMNLREEELKVFKIVDSAEDVLHAIADFEEELDRGIHEHLDIDRDGFGL